MAGTRSRSSSNLELPRKSVELYDTGTRDLESSEDEEYFSDASEGRKRISRPATPSSPIPRTRVEKVDDIPRHGEIPGSAAYEQRTQDAVPDEVEVLPEASISRKASTASLDPPRTPGGTIIPRTVVEKVDPSSPSYGDVPGTEAYNKRQADAAPDLILKAPEQGHSRVDIDPVAPEATHSKPVPETVVTRVDSLPAHGEVANTAARDMRSRDAEPDKVFIAGDVPRSPTLDRSLRNPSAHYSGSQKSDGFPLQGDTAGFGDDFDNFEEGGLAGMEDDFGDFDDGFQEPQEDEIGERHVQVVEGAEERLTLFPTIDFESLSSTPDLLEAMKVHLDAMFPNTTAEHLSSLSTPEPIPAESPIFPSERSRSLWKQLITPPPLQPSNWTKSRIRRLFLVSLGVPVDLDEILPPSKQKKLILPDINIEQSSRTSESDRALGSIARLKAKATNESSASVDSAQSGTKSNRRKAKGPGPPPDLDLAAVRRLCATTNEKLDGFTDEELRIHVKELQEFTARTSELLEYWLKRRDSALKEKEAFEGVIENLVKHARRVRK